MEGRGKWWRAIAGLLIRFTVCKTVVIIILNAPSVKLTAWIPTFISNIIDRLSIVRGAQWQIMGYVLLLGVWILPQCNYAMLILLPYTMHLPWQKQGLPTVRMSQTGGEVKYEWINVLVCVLAVPTKTRALPPFLPFSSGAHRRGGGGEASAGALLLCFQRRGRMQVRPPWTPQLDLLCRRWTGSGRAPPPPPLPPQHEDSVSIGHGTDTGSTDKSLSRSLRRTLLGSEVTC